MKTATNKIISGTLAAAVLALSGCADHGGNQSSEMGASGMTGSGGTPIQVTGEPGSPGATTTISGRQLPPPDPQFGGVIKDNAMQSKAWWAPRIVPPKQAP